MMPSNSGRLTPGRMNVPPGAVCEIALVPKNIELGKRTRVVTLLDQGWVAVNLWTKARGQRLQFPDFAGIRFRVRPPRQLGHRYPVDEGVCLYPYAFNARVLCGEQGCARTGKWVKNTHFSGGLGGCDDRFDPLC